MESIRNIGSNKAEQNEDTTEELPAEKTASPKRRKKAAADDAQKETAQDDSAKLFSAKQLPEKLGSTDKKHTYYQRKGQIHTDDGSYLTQSHIIEEGKKTAAVELMHSFTNQRALKARVFGVRRAFDRNINGNFSYYVIAQYGPYQVFIPAEKFTEEDFDALLARNQRNNPNFTKDATIRTYLQARLDAEIDFIVTNMPTGGLMESNFVGGSRADAMRLKRFHYWFRGTKQDGTDLINIGDLAKARIISVSRNGIRVEFCGAEAGIPLRELSWTMMQDAADEFRVGESVIIRIMDITKNEDDNYKVEFKASVKQAKPDPREEAMEKYQDGGVYCGEVAYIRLPDAEHPNSKISVFVKLEEGVQVQCPMPYGRRPVQVGERVHCTITNRIQERNYLYGKIRL